MTDYEKFETGEKPQAYSWQGDEAPSAKTETMEIDPSLESKFESMSNELEGNLDIVKKEIEDIGGPEKLDEVLDNNPVLKQKLLDNAERLLTAFEGIVTLGIGVGGSAIFAMTKNAPMNAELAVGSFIFGVTMGCYELLTAIRGKEWKPFAPEKEV